MVTNNNLLSKDEQEKLFLYGKNAIPEKYRIEKKRKLPKHISFSEKTNTYRVQVTFEGKTMGKKYIKTYEEAQKILTKFLDRKKEMIKEKRRKTLEENKDNIIGEYGYLKIPYNNDIFIVKLNKETYSEFIHCTWYINNSSKPTPRGSYNGISKNLHMHVIEFYYEDYDKRIDGTIDHRYQDYHDCTIENLRKASPNLQAHNISRDNVLGFTGISLSGDNFVISRTTKTFRYIYQAIDERNLYIIDKYKKDENGEVVGNLLEYPQNNFTVEELYNIKNLDENKIRNAFSNELLSIYLVNPEIQKLLNDKGFTKTKINKKKNKDNIKNLIINRYFRNNKICLNNSFKYKR